MAAPLGRISKCYDFFQMFRKQKNISCQLIEKVLSQRYCVKFSTNQIEFAKVTRCVQSRHWAQACRLQINPVPINPVSCMHYRNFSVLLRERTCWKCGSETGGDKELFFCNCGIVQQVPNDLTFFKAMDTDETFDIDTDGLAQLYKKLQWNLHPDKYSAKSEEEQHVAEHQSAFINKAYTVLSKPLSRGLYILTLRGHPVEEGDNSVEAEFLMEIMELNEDLAAAADNKDTVLAMDKSNAAKIDTCVRGISASFGAGDLVAAKDGLIRLQYLTNLEEKMKEIYRQQMD